MGSLIAFAFFADAAGIRTLARFLGFM